MRAIVASTLLAGCIVIPSKPPVMCQTDADCDTSAGEVCQQNVCWGDPPTGTFAATLTAPAVATELIGRQIPVLALPPAGFIDDLVLQAPAMFQGRVVASCDTCDTSAVGAQLTLTLPPVFSGGPSLSLSADSTAQATGASFGIPVAPSQYELTITPTDDPDAQPSPATVVPPLRTQVTLTGNTDQTFTLGGTGLQHVTGTLVDANGLALGGYDVVARGRWSPEESEQVVSSVTHVGADGTFDLVLSDGVMGTLDIVATPSSTNMAIVPSLELTGIPQPAAGSGSATPNTLSVPKMLGKLISVDVVVNGNSSNGGIVPISGVAVDVTGSVGGSADQPTVASLEVQGTTGSDGIAHLAVLDGLGTYAINLIPPATSSAAATFGQTLSPALGTQTYHLQPRISVHGTVVDTGGHPVSGMQVTATPSNGYLWSLAPAAQAFHEAVTLSPATSGSDGGFAVLVDPAIVDPSIDGVQASYDLQLEPASETTEPHSSVAAIAIAPTAMDVPVGVVSLPAPAFLHGQVTDPVGNPVMGANLAIYLVISDQTACTAPNAPSPCQVPAQQLAHATSDVNGIVKFSLPR